MILFLKLIIRTFLKQKTTHSQQAILQPDQYTWVEGQKITYFNSSKKIVGTFILLAYEIQYEFVLSEWALSVYVP